AREFAEAAWATAADRSAPAKDERRRTLNLPRQAWEIAASVGAVAIVGLVVAWLAGSGGRPARPSLRPGPAPTPAAPILDHDGARYAVGDPGDVVLAGRFGCTSETAAVLTPSGRLYVFDGWAVNGQDLPARHVGDVTPGSAVRAADQDGDGCDDLI